MVNADGSNSQNGNHHFISVEQKTFVLNTDESRLIVMERGKGKVGFLNIPCVLWKKLCNFL